MKFRDSFMKLMKPTDWRPLPATTVPVVLAFYALFTTLFVWYGVHEYRSGGDDAEYILLGLLCLGVLQMWWALRAVSAEVEMAVDRMLLLPLLFLLKLAEPAMEVAFRGM